MIFHRTERFQKAYKKLPGSIQRKADKALLLFDRNPRHPSLHVEKIDFLNDIWSARVDINYRLTFQWIEQGIRLRNIGPHERAYRGP